MGQKDKSRELRSTLRDVQGGLKVVLPLSSETFILKLFQYISVIVQYF